MKKRIVLIIVIVLPVILCLIAVYAVPIGRFKNQTKEFDQFVTEIKEESLTRKHVRVEMSTEEYARVKSEILSKWFDAEEQAKQSEPGCVLSSDLFSEQEREGKREAYLSYFACNGLFNITGNMVYENVAVCVHEDVVYLEYVTYINLASFPFGQVK